MTNQIPPPGWFLRPENWPYGPLLGNTFTPSQPPVDPWGQIDAQWWQQQPAGANDRPATPQPNDAWDRTTPAWLRSAMPPLSNREILGSFPHPNDLSEASVSSQSGVRSAAGRGILGQFDHWNDPQTSSTGRGILAPLERLNNPSNQSAPAWLQSAAPFGLNDGSFLPPQMISQPWDSPWPKEPAAAQGQPPAPPVASQLPRSAGPYASAQEPNGSVAPPLQHLESANYWGAGPTSRRASEHLPPSGFYLSPVPQAPTWVSVPRYLTDNAARIFQRPPSPTSWGGSTPDANDAGSSPTPASWPASEAELVQDAFRAAAEKIGRRGRREAVDQPLPLPPPPQYLESARYWSAQPGPSDAGDPPPAQGSYLALAPTATPWPASPNLPSATSWGDVATGIEPQRSGLGGAIARTWDNPTAPVAGQITLPLIGAPSLIGLLKSLWSGATLPGDVLAAKVDPLSDEGIARSSDLALMGRLSAANQPGTLGLGTMRGATLKNFTRPQVGRTLKDIPPHLTDDEAREAINAYRWEKLGPDLFGQKEEKGVVAVTKGEGRNEFGVNSGLPTYEERAAADRLRDKLLEKYPELNKQDKIGYNTGWMPNDAFYHAETSLLLRLARQNGGSLSGREFTVHVDKEMCPSCRTMLPYIGLELGNPTVTFVDHTGGRIIMRDGKLLKLTGKHL